MTFVYEPELAAYMEQKRLSLIAVEVVTANADIDYTELYVHLVRPGIAEELVKRKKYRRVETAHGAVLLPPYRLEYADTVTFRLKKTWIFRSVGFDGISL